MYNYGRVDDLHHNGGINYGSSNKQQTQEKVVYRDCIVEKEVVKWKYRDREKIVYRDNDETAHLRDLLDASMEVNHRQAERIKETELLSANIEKARLLARRTSARQNPTAKNFLKDSICLLTFKRTSGQSSVDFSCWRLVDFSCGRPVRIYNQ